MKSIWKENKTIVIISFISIFISSFATIGLEYLKGLLVDLGISQDIDSFVKISIGLLLIIILKSSTHYIYSSRFMRFKVNAMSRIREELFKSLVKREYPEYLKKNTGEYFSLYTNQINSLDMSYFQSISGLLQILTELLISFVFLYIINPKLCLYAFITLIPSLLVPKIASGFLVKARKEAVEKMDKNLSKLKEYLSGFEIIKTFNKTDVFVDKFYESTSVYERSAYKMSKTRMLFHYMSNLLVNLSGLVIIVVSVFDVANNKISIGQFVAAYGIMSQLTTQVVYISSYVQELISIRVVINYLFEIIESHKEIEKTKKLYDIKSIEFKNINFSYDENELIKDFDYKFEKPGIYQIMGESGSGKSTLLSLLFNYFNPDLGNVLINDINVSDIGNLTELITVMRQEAIFFGDSLRNNISMYQNIDDKRIIELMRAIGLEKYANIEDLNRDMTNVENSFSGGEARRLMIIRSLLRDTPILILDEPLANLDSNSKEKIEEILGEIKGKFIFIITHQKFERDEAINETIFMDEMAEAN
ncbi:MAG: ABC transporter ATP-binding protein [Tissierellia bacterium]|nr:ABC transporter ATP-binding protein [Tissierellia bacterium]